MAGAIEDWSKLLGSSEPLGALESVESLESEELLESGEPVEPLESAKSEDSEESGESLAPSEQRIIAYRERGRLKRSLKDYPGSAADWREAARLLEERGQEQEAQDILNQLSQGDEWGD